MGGGGYNTMLVVTTEHVPGFAVTVAIGEVCGVAALPRNAYTAGIKELSGAANPRVNQELANAREEAVTELARVARRRGANAVIGMRFDTRDITAGWAEICAYGTAVRVERVAPRPAPVPRASGTASTGQVYRTDRSVQPGTPP
jgi:uncharacterized protein YbjQ (UPF0145 family)